MSNSSRRHCLVRRGRTRCGLDPNGNTPECGGAYCCRRSIQFAQRSRPPESRRLFLGNQRPIRRNFQTDSTNQYVWKKRLRCLRRHIWCGWRGAFRQHASFESSAHPKSWGLASVLYANKSSLNDGTRYKLFTPDCIDAYPRPLVVDHSLRIGGGSPSSLFRRTKRFPDKPRLCPLKTLPVTEPIRPTLQVTLGPRTEALAGN